MESSWFSVGRHHAVTWLWPSEWDMMRQQTPNQVSFGEIIWEGDHSNVLNGPNMME